MPGNVANTLYAPVISTFMPAFATTNANGVAQPAVVYYSLSPYNNSGEIRRVHMTVVNQSNNENALKSTVGIKMVEFNSGSYDTSKNMYKIEISPTDLAGGQFNINQFYKVQLRFDTYTGTDVPSLETMTDKELNNYLLDHQAYFSEWSTVCLIRPILRPSVYVIALDGTDAATPSFNKGIVPLVGTVMFGSGINSETETVQSYRIQILPQDDDEILMTTETIYTNDSVDPNSINYKLDLQGLDTSENSLFRMRFTVTTKNLFVLTQDYEFQIADFLQEENFDPDIELSVNDDNGTVTVSVKNIETVFGTLYIRRSSSLSDFKDWEDLHVENVSGAIDMEIEDPTVSSLVWYRYSAQLENSAGAMTRVYYSTQILPRFYDAIFSREDKKFIVRYNYSISSLKPVVNRTKIDTLGGRFPKFVENAVLNYKQFSISGYIASEADVYQNFLDKSEWFGDRYADYDIYRDEENVQEIVRNDFPDYDLGDDKYLTTTTRDYMWERAFREEATKWLNDGEPKLYRSMTEGTMVVMLTDVNLTPNAQLSRNLWTFSATVYEIAEGDSLDTLDSLGIFEVMRPDSGDGTEGQDPEPEYVEVECVGSLYQFDVTDTDSIFNKLQSDLDEKYSGVRDNRDPSELRLKAVKLFFQSNPSPYVFTSNTGVGGIELVDLNHLENYKITDIHWGYSFNLTIGQRTESIFVGKDGYYEVPSEFEVSDLSFNKIGDKVTMECVMTYKEKNDESSIISGTTIDRTIIGQEMGVFEANKFIGDTIKRKYSFVKTDDFYQQLQYWIGISVDVEPFSVVHVLYEGQSDYIDYVVGKTGILNLMDNFKIHDLCFLGRKMNLKSEERQPYLDGWEYVKDDTEYANVSEIQNPSFGTVYSIGDALKVYWKDGKWYDFTENNDNTGIAAVPTQGMVNYFGNVMQSSYA